MSFIENVLDLISKNGITKNKMLKDLKMGTGTFNTWQKRGTIPKGEILSKIANYFNVSTDYLLGNEQKNKPTINDGGLGPKGKAIQERLNRIEKLSDEDYDLAVAQLDLIIKRRENQDNQ